jgi:plastocyanin
LSTIFGETVELEGGEQVEVTEAYLLRSIMQPDAQVVKDYPSGKMPSRFANLQEEDLASLVSYVKVLSDEELSAQLLPATSFYAPVQIAPAGTVVWMWVFLGFCAVGLASVNVVFMSRTIPWGWIGLIVVIPLVGAAAGVGWANYSASTGNTYREFEVVAHQFAYDPPIIRVNKGDHVTIALRSEDTLHGFYLDGYGIDQEVRPGETIRFEFDANKAGRFGFRCSHTCGVFHPFMMGTFIVAPNNLFSGSLGLVFGLGLATFVYVAKKPE